MGVVLDASVLLAFLHEEPGGEQVSAGRGACLGRQRVWGLEKSLQRGVNVEGMNRSFTDVGVIFEPFTPEVAISGWRSAATKGAPSSVISRPGTSRCTAWAGYWNHRRKN